MVVTGHHYRGLGVERKLFRVLEDFLPSIERWHGVQATEEQVE